MTHNIEQINIDNYPNVLAHIQVDMQSKSIECIEERRDEDMPKRKNNKRKNIISEKNANKFDQNEVNRIWKCMSLGKIDISYACVGYLLDGRPVLDHSDLVDLMINYGFAIDDILAFIDEFTETSKNEPYAPVIMFNSNVSKIMTEVEPIEK